MNDQILGLLGLMRRAGKLIAGHDAVSDRIRDNTAIMIVLAEDTSERSEKSIAFLGKQFGVDILRIPVGMTEIGRAIGRGKIGVLAVTDRGFAQSLRALSGQG